MKLVNKIFGKLEYLFYKRRISLLSTFYLNLRTLPFPIALKFPIWVYGRVDFASLKGSIIINSGNVKSGMIKLGRHCDNYILHSKKQFIQIDEDACVIFNGYTSIASDFLLRITGKGMLEFGDRVWIGQGVKFDCTEKITIGECSSITYNTSISDSNHHYMIDEHNNIERMSAPIKIGEYNWIGNNSVITKGCKTSDYTIVAHGSLLNKDYILLDKSTTPMILVGEPAKIVGYNKRRVFDSRNEIAINKYFSANPSEQVLHWTSKWIDEVELKYFL